MLSTLSPLTIVQIVCALVAIALFVAGYVKGFRTSITEFDAAVDTTKEDKARSFGFLIPMAVVAAGVVIALLGVSPIFIAIAPFLSIASAAVIGLLFFIEPHLD